MERIPKKAFIAMWSQTESGQENHVTAPNHNVLNCKHFVTKLYNIYKILLFFKWIYFSEKKKRIFKWNFIELLIVLTSQWTFSDSLI